MTQVIFTVVRGSVQYHHHGAGYATEAGTAGGEEEGRPREAVQGLGRLHKGVPRSSWRRLVLPEPTPTQRGPMTRVQRV